MLYAAYTRREFDAADECAALGITCYVPRRVDLVRQGKRRRPDAVTRPYLPGYAFCEATDAQWHQLRASKHIRSLMGIGPSEARRVMEFINRVEADYAHRMAQIEAGDRVSEYNDGDILAIIAGPLAGQLARFKRIAEAGMFPEIVAEIDVMGRAATVRLDPLVAKRAG